jgi:sugar phosphate isomerase/epimerase
MRLGLSIGGPVFEIAQEYGAAGIAIWFEELVSKGPDQATGEIRQHGLEVCQIGAHTFNPLHPDSGELARQRDLLEKTISLAPETGCRDILVNGGNYEPEGAGFAMGHPDNFTDKALDAAARGLEDVVKSAEKHGCNIVVEPFVQCVVNTPERFLALKEKVGSDALTVTLDICNFFNYEALWHPTEVVRHACTTLAGHYTVVHAKDVKLTPGVIIHMDEAPLGTGVMDWVTAMEHIGRVLPADGYVVLEHADTAEAARCGLDNLRKAAEQAGVTFG